MGVFHGNRVWCHVVRIIRCGLSGLNLAKQVTTCPSLSGELLYVFRDDDKSIGGLREMRLFTKFAARKEDVHLRSEHHTFPSQGYWAFASCLQQHSGYLSSGDKAIDISSLPLLSEWFGNAEEETHGEEQASASGAETKGGGNLTRKGSGILASPAHPKRPPSLASPAKPAQTAVADSPIAGGASPAALGGSPTAADAVRAGTTGADDNQTDAEGDFASTVEDGEVVDMAQVPSDVPQACEFWIRKMPLQEIMEGRKLGHAIRQGNDLVEKSLKTDALVGKVSTLRLHVKLANIARTLAPGRKCIERLNDSDLLLAAQELTGARVSLPLHVQEQFLTRAAVRVRSGLTVDSADDTCKTYVDMVAPWRRGETVPFRCDAPRLCDLAADGKRRTDVFKRMFVGDLIIPLIVKEEGAKDLLLKVCQCCLAAFEGHAEAEFVDVKPEVYLETLGCLRAAPVLIRPVSLLADFSLFGNLRLLKNQASNTAGRNISAHVGAALVGSTYYAKTLHEILMTESTSLKVQDDVHLVANLTKEQPRLTAKDTDDMIKSCQRLPIMKASLMGTLAIKVERDLESLVTKTIDAELRRSSGAPAADDKAISERLVQLQRLVSEAMVTWPLSDVFASKQEEVGKLVLAHTSTSRRAALSAAIQACHTTVLEKPSDLQADSFKNLTSCINDCAGLPPLADKENPLHPQVCGLLSKLHTVALQTWASLDDDGVWITAFGKHCDDLSKTLAVDTAGPSMPLHTRLVMKHLLLRRALHAFVSLGQTTIARFEADVGCVRLSALSSAADALGKVKNDILTLPQKPNTMFMEALGVLDEAAAEAKAASEVDLANKKTELRNAIAAADVIKLGMADGQYWAEGIQNNLSWQSFLKHVVATILSGSAAAKDIRQAHERVDQAICVG